MSAGRAQGRSQAGPHPLGGSPAVPRGRGAPITHLLYLHGFRSSPQSAKARQMAAWMKAHRPDVAWCCPQLPPSPREAWTLIDQAIAGWPRATMAVVGSSLGGFYATAVAEATGCRAVVINPAVDPARDLARHIGEQTMFHDPAQRFFFRREFIDELRDLTVPFVSLPERYLAMIAKGDELLDWREMTGRYPGAQQLVLEGGDHAFSDFDAHLHRLTDFLELTSSP